VTIFQKQTKLFVRYVQTARKVRGKDAGLHHVTAVVYNYRVSQMSVKHFKNSQQIDYATDQGSSYGERERKSPSFFKEKPANIVAPIYR
jgi:hypothetical protein